MLNREQRIEKAMEQIEHQHAKDIFMELANKYQDMSVFWNEEDRSASLQNEQVCIEVS